MQSFLSILLSPFTAAVAAVRWGAKASLAARITWIVALFQFLVVVLAAIVVLGTGDRAVLQSWWSPGKVLALLLLLVLVPWLVYQAARLWLEHQGGRWPDIAAAWSAAVAELGRQQITLTEAPLFLVLGSDGGPLERALLGDSPTPLVVEQSPAGGGPLHVYASRDAIFVCCSGAGQTASAAAAVKAASVEGMTVGGDAQPADAPAGGWQPVARQGPSPRTAKERREASDRLEYACIQLLQARIPLAAVNGVVVMLPLQVNRDGDADAVSLGQAVGEDLATVIRVLGVLAPVTLVAGVLQDDPAIDDLLTRLDAGKRDAACGHAFPPGLPPTPEHLHGLAFNATGSLMDMLAELLLDPRRIADQPANRHLLAMLGRLRLHVGTQLARLLPQAFSPELHRGADGHGGGLPLLAGCYVVSLSAASGRRAFVRGMLEAVVQVQGELDWTDESLRADRWAGRVSRILFTAVAVMVAAIVTIVWWSMSR
jgi:hypothetical protein